jgi:lipoic acid synthetase
MQVNTFDPNMFTKSSIMVGVGEEKKEVVECMADLRAVNTDFLTIGQYLQPSQKHLKLQDYIHPDTFEEYRILGESIGFKYVASGPLVRSSYRAGEFFIHRYLNKVKAANS